MTLATKTFTDRVQFMADPAQSARVEEFRRAAGMKGTAEAIRALIDAGLTALATPTPPPAPKPRLPRKP